VSGDHPPPRPASRRSRWRGCTRWVRLRFLPRPLKWAARGMTRSFVLKIGRMMIEGQREVVYHVFFSFLFLIFFYLLFTVIGGIN
jgi:hypothetical protein